MTAAGAASFRESTFRSVGITAGGSHSAPAWAGKALSGKAESSIMAA